MTQGHDLRFVFKQIRLRLNYCPTDIILLYEFYCEYPIARTSLCYQSYLRCLSNHVYSISFTSPSEATISYFVGTNAACKNETYMTPRWSSYKLDQHVVKLYWWVQVITKLGFPSCKSKNCAVTRHLMCSISMAINRRLWIHSPPPSPSRQSEQRLSYYGEPHVVKNATICTSFHDARLWSILRSLSNLETDIVAVVWRPRYIANSSEMMSLNYWLYQKWNKTTVTNGFKRKEGCQ